MKKCKGCKFFNPCVIPKLPWAERYEVIKEMHPTLTRNEICVLADKEDLLEMCDSDTWGFCHNKELPMLRDVQLNGTDFGCIKYKKNK